MKIAFREKMILAGAGLLVLIVVWYMLFYSKQSGKMAMIQSQIAQLTQQLNQAQMSAKNIKELEAEVDSLKVFHESLGQKILPKTKLLYITQEIQRRSSDFRLKVNTITVDKSKLFGEAGNVSPFLWIPIEMDISGEFFSFGKFLDDFENYSFIIRPGEVKIITDNTTYPALSIFLVAYAYVAR